MLKRFAEFLLPGGPEPSERPEICYQLATCVVLLEAARIDHDFTRDERTQITAILQKQFALSEVEAEELLAVANAEHGATNDLWRFTNQINQTFSQDEKIRIMELVWRVFYSDGYLSGHEDHLAHKLRSLLNLNHPQMIQAKMAVLDEMREKT